MQEKLSAFLVGSLHLASSYIYIYISLSFSFSSPVLIKCNIVLINVLLLSLYSLIVKFVNFLFMFFAFR